MDQYREFRQQVLDNEKSGRCRRTQYREASRSRCSDARIAISDFREGVATQADQLIDLSEESRKLVHRALRIDLSVSVKPNAWRTVLWFLVGAFLPTTWGIRLARCQLRMARTFEGRKLIFERFVRHALPGHKRFYDYALDFALLRFTPIRSQDELDSLDRLDFELLKAAYLLGLRSANEVLELFPLGAEQQEGWVLQTLVSEGVIRARNEIVWVGKPEQWPRSIYGRSDESQKEVLRDTLRCLLSHGIDRQTVAGVVGGSLYSLNPEVLSSNLTLLSSQSTSNLSDVFKALGDRLWNTPTSTWRFVVEDLGAKSASELSKFKHVLNIRRPLPKGIAQQLGLLGALLDDFVELQAFLLELNLDRSSELSCIENIQRLSGKPYALSFAQLSQCSAYVGGGEALAPFLGALVSNGFSNSQAILDFQRCFRVVPASDLDRILKILGARGKKELLPNVAAWVLQAHKCGSLDVYDFLVPACGIDDLASLRQALKVVSLGVPLLQYLIEVRKLASLKEIREWYYKARGIEGYRSWGTYDGVDLVLLDDAFSRNQFNYLSANQEVVRAAVRRHVEQKIGPWPRTIDEQARESYQQCSQELSKQIRPTLTASVDTILRSTDGVLLPTLLEDDDELSLKEKLARFQPLLADLLIGRGVAGPSITSLEVDAVSLVYKTPVTTVRSFWGQVQGREIDCQKLRLRKNYCLSWRQVRRRLQKKLDMEGFFALEKAAAFARGFNPEIYRDMFTACQHLSPKQLAPDFTAADTATLSFHLGSLLAMAKANDEVSRWVMEGFDELTRIDFDSMYAYQRIGELVDLFEVLLPDALAENARSYVGNLPDQDAAHWAARLGPRVAAESGQQQLQAMLQRTCETVLPHYLKWAQRQYKRYEDEEDATLGAQQLVAFITKHPAAFFAKSAVNLCSAGNVDMWREERLFHLVVFDSAGQRFAGMALIYVQSLPGLDDVRPSLVIRAINPTSEMLAGHSPQSIVESFFDVAVQLAEENDLACVAFPEPSGMHFMSNHGDIEKYITKNYLKQASRQGAPKGGLALRAAPERVEENFYAYQTGVELVKTLYVIWRSATP